VHLGASPDAGYPWSGTRKNEIWETFRTIIRDAGEEKADLLLIAGDLFHRQPEPEELREINYLFASIPNTRVVLIAGNHDYIQPSSPYLNFEWAPNVACLFSRKCECVRFPEIQTEVYGLSYDRQEITEPLYDSLHPVKSRAFHILLAHGGDREHIPIDPKALASSGFDYIALGHIHKPTVLIPDKAVYPGALSPIDAGDEGPHGYIAGQTHGTQTEVHFVKKALREYVSCTVEADEEDTVFSIRDRVQAAIASRGPENLYKVTISGLRNPAIEYDTELIRSAGMILEVKDQSVPAFHMEELKTRYRGTLIGRYIESFEGKDLTDTEKKALRYGLEALLSDGARRQG
jgi:DNA repair exonuclease SbcCD nuclease subunit